MKISILLPTFMSIVIILGGFAFIYSQETENDSLEVGTQADSLTAYDLEQSDYDKKVEKIKIMRRNFNYRNQVASALFMMGFVALIITSVQNWNPD